MTTAATRLDVPRRASVLDVELTLGECVPLTSAVGQPLATSRLFSGKANSGAIMQHWWYGQLALDMSGGRVNRKDLPVLRDHDPSRIAGHTSKVKLSKDGIDVEGRLVDITPAGRESIDLLAAGIPLQMSIWFQPQRMLRLAEKESAKVNGLEMTGPGVIVKEWTLREVTLTALGVDEATGAQLLAAVAGDDSVAVDGELQTEQETKVEKEQLSVAALSERHPEVVAQVRAESLATGQAQERERIAFVTDRAAKLGTPAAVVQRAIAEGWDREKVAIEFADELAARRTTELGRMRSESPQPTGGSPPGHDELDSHEVVEGGAQDGSADELDAAVTDDELLEAEAKRRWKANAAVGRDAEGNPVLLQTEYGSFRWFLADFKAREARGWLAERSATAR